MTKPPSDITRFVPGLLKDLAATIPHGPDHDANVAKALAMFDALRPADMAEAMATMLAIASHFAAMDCFARAEDPGVGASLAKRLRSTAISLGRPMDELLGERRKRKQPADLDPAGRLARRADFLAMQTSPVRH